MFQAGSPPYISLYHCINSRNIGQTAKMFPNKDVYTLTHIYIYMYKYIPILVKYVYVYIHTLIHTCPPKYIKIINQNVNSSSL